MHVRVCGSPGQATAQGHPELPWPEGQVRRPGCGRKSAVHHQPNLPEKLEGLVEPLTRILDRDLAAAGIPKRDERNRVVDVHALRVTFGTHLCAAGVPLRTAQAAMRHSKPELTANIYTDPKLLDVAGAIDALPALALPPKDARSVGVPPANQRRRVQG